MLRLLRRPLLALFSGLLAAMLLPASALADEPASPRIGVLLESLVGAGWLNASPEAGSFWNAMGAGTGLRLGLRSGPFHAAVRVELYRGSSASLATPGAQAESKAGLFETEFGLRALRERRLELWADLGVGAADVVRAGTGPFLTVEDRSISISFSLGAEARYYFDTARHLFAGVNPRADIVAFLQGSGDVVLAPGFDALVGTSF